MANQWLGTVITGQLTINHATPLVTTNATISIFATPTTVTAFAAATALTLGAGSGAITLSAPTIGSGLATVALWNTVSTTVNAFGAATALNILSGSYAGNGQADITIGNGTDNWARVLRLKVKSNAFGSGQLIFAEGSTDQWILYKPTGTDALRVYNSTATAGDVIAITKTGIALTGVTTLSTTAATLALFNTTSTTINFGGAATTLSVGAGAASTANFNFTTAINLNTAAIVSNQTTVAVINTNATTVNAFGAASTALNIGNAAAPATFAGGVALSDAKNFATGTTTGSIVAATTAQKLGFWGKTPIVQPASANQAALALDVDVTGADTVDKAAINTNFTAIQTLLNQIRSDLVAAGNIKGSA